MQRCCGAGNGAGVKKHPVLVIGNHLPESLDAQPVAHMVALECSSVVTSFKNHQQPAASSVNGIVDVRVSGGAVG